MTELTYKNDLGEDVKTSQFLKNRNSCCQTTCLHCPYGFTIKKHGLAFSKILEKSLKKAQSILAPKPAGAPSLSQSMLDSAFGGAKKKKIRVLNKFNMNDFRFIHLNENVCGILELKDNQGTELYLQQNFEKQDLTLDLVMSYFHSSQT